MNCALSYALRAEQSGGCRERSWRAAHDRRNRQRDGVGTPGRQPGRRGSADWLTMTSGGLMLPDVRLAIKTGDGAVVLSRRAPRPGTAQRPTELVVQLWPPAT